MNLKRKLKQLAAFWPTNLPIGVSDFETWASDIIFTYNLPDNDSFRFSLATMIQHCDRVDAKKSKRYFGLCALKGAANQVAGYIMNELKLKQQAAAQEAAKAATEAETSGTDTKET